MLDAEQQEEIVIRRSKGQSLRSIAETMDVSKTTVALHVRKLALEIQNAVNLEKDALIERVQLSAAKRLETTLELMRKIADEMLGRDLTQVATDKLLGMFLTLEEKTSQEARVQMSAIELVDPMAHLLSNDQTEARINWEV